MSMTSKKTEGKSNRKAVYTIIETGEGQSIWRQIGSAFVNKDSSINVVLDAFPCNGKLHIRDPKSRQKVPSDQG